jgi:hypothetical protein
MDIFSECRFCSLGRNDISLEKASTCQAQQSRPGKAGTTGAVADQLFCNPAEATGCSASSIHPVPGAQCHAEAMLITSLSTRAPLSETWTAGMSSTHCPCMDNRVHGHVTSTFSLKPDVA